LLRPGGLSTPHAPATPACVRAALSHLIHPAPLWKRPTFYPRDPLLPCGTWRHPCGALEAPRRRPCDALATPLRHLASLLAPHPLPAPSLPRRGGSLTLSLYLDCSASVAAPREAAPSMRVPVAILSARAMPATRDAHALRAHTGVVLRPSSPP